MTTGSTRVRGNCPGLFIGFRICELNVKPVVRLVCDLVIVFRRGFMSYANYSRTNSKLEAGDLYAVSPGSPS